MHEIGVVNQIPEPTIAVVIPARNSCALIPRALESVLSQSRLPEEIIVVDDGSTDGTAAAVSAFGDDVTLIVTPQRGVAAARNTAVHAASADFIAFLDADDYWDCGHLDRIGRVIEKTEGRASLYFSDMRMASVRGGATNWALCGFGIEGSFELRESEKDWLFDPQHPMLIQASVVRRDAYLRVGGCDEQLVRRSDTHLIFKLGLDGPMCAVAGLAGKWTADDRTSLTWSYASSHRVYHRCTSDLYDDLLNSRAPMDRGQREILARRAANAHLALARCAGPHRLHEFGGHIWAAMRRDPAAVAQAAARAAHRAWQSAQSAGSRQVSPPAVSSDTEPCPPPSPARPVERRREIASPR